MRAWIGLGIAAALGTAAFAAGDRWTTSYNQGTLEAVINNAHGASLNIYCPSGQNDHTPGMFIEAEKFKPKAGEKVDIQLVVDGKNNAFSFDEIEYKASDAAGLASLDMLIDALAKSRRATFAMNIPAFAVSEALSTAGARKALKSARDFLDGCR